MEIIVVGLPTVCQSAIQRRPLKTVYGQAAGHILIDSTYPRILLGSAHGDYMEGDALVKELTSAQVGSIAEDAPASKRHGRPSTTL